MRLAPAVAIGTIATLCTVCGAAAQDPEGGRQTTGTSLAGLGAAVGRSFDRPLHPVVQTVASGGWLGAGVGYDAPALGGLEIGAKAVVTVRRYWLAEIDAAYERGRLAAIGYARARSMNRLNFFGLGPASEPFDQSSFTLRDPVVGVLGSVAVAPGIRVGGRVEGLWPRVTSGRHPERPTIEDRFGAAAVPGLDVQPAFGRYQALVEIRTPKADAWGLDQGGAYRLSYEVYDDRGTQRFDFRRLEAEGRHTFAVAMPYHSVTLRGWLSSAEPRGGREVPFFLQHTLGGTSNIRSVADEPLGGDGTDATLRGYANHRFRDNHLLLLQAEYRWPVWGPVDTTVFVDAGKAVSSRSDIDFSGLRADYGFSISLMRAASTVARADVAFGGDQGSRIYFSLGGLLP